MTVIGSSVSLSSRTPPSCPDRFEVYPNIAARRHRHRGKGNLRSLEREVEAEADPNDSLSEASLDHQRSNPRTTPSPKRNPRPKPEDAKEGHHLSRSCSSAGRGDPPDRMAPGRREQESGPSRAVQPGCQRGKGRRGRGRQRENLRDTPHTHTKHTHTTHTPRGKARIKHSIVVVAVTSPGRFKLSGRCGGP